MRAQGGRLSPYEWVASHLVDLAFGLLAIAWLWYVMRINRDMSFWSDDLRVIDQAGTLGGLFEPYNQHMSLVPLASNRLLAEVSDLAFTPFMVFGALSYLAVSVTYYATTRRQLGPPLAALLSLLLLFADGLITRPASASHYLSAVGAIVCAGALNRGRRADLPLALALLFALCSAGGGVVVAGACVLHSLLVRAPLRRWLAVLVPSAMYGVWWLLAAEAASPASNDPLSASETARVVVELCLSPFYAVSFHNRPIAYLLMVAFLGQGIAQLRGGLRAGANFLAWTAAMVAWAYALVQSRGGGADVFTFRYVYLSLVFALLAIVPARPIRWPAPVAVTNRRWLASAALGILVFGALSAVWVRDDLQEVARRNAELGREADGTMLVLGLGPEVIPDETRIAFFGFHNPHGSARRLRGLMDRYGSPFATTPATVDQDLVDLGVVRRSPLALGPFPGCEPLTEPISQPGLATRGLGEPPPETLAAGPAVEPLKLWSPERFTLEVRRYGEDWVEVGDVAANHTVVLTLPAMSTEQPWEVRADGACDVGA
jgi:hypothetical protein